MSLLDTLKGKLNLAMLCSPMFTTSTLKMGIEQCYWLIPGVQRPPCGKT